MRRKLKQDAQKVEEERAAPYPFMIFFTRMTLPLCIFSR